MQTSKLLNQHVRNGAGEDIGTIDDIIIDPATGLVQYAVLSAGGRLLAVPWSTMRVSPSRDHMILALDQKMLDRAPAFDRSRYPDMNDPVWHRHIHDYYAVPVVEERRLRPVRPVRQGMSLGAGIALVCLVLALGWMTFLVSTRGWEDAKQNVQSSVQSAVYAAKETGQDAALTTKVKTALALSKRVQSTQITVESDSDVVTLRGEVPSQQVSEAAESIARDVPGVGDVQNHMFVATRTQ